MIRPDTLKCVLYTSNWIINSYVFKAELFLYVAYEAKHYGVVSFDVVIVRTGALSDHTTARYVIKYIPCVDKTILRRNTIGCRLLRSGYCVHTANIGRNHLSDMIRSIYDYLHEMSFRMNPNNDYDYHMRLLCNVYGVIVSKYLIKQFMIGMALLYSNTRIIANCECCTADCECKSIVDYFQK
jgi:hypothetical protein